MIIIYYYDDEVYSQLSCLVHIKKNSFFNVKLSWDNWRQFMFVHLGSIEFWIKNKVKIDFYTFIIIIIIKYFIKINWNNNWKKE